MRNKWLPSADYSTLLRGALALAFSVLLHLLLLGQLNLKFSFLEPENQVVEIRFSDPVKKLPSLTPPVAVDAPPARSAQQQKPEQKPQQESQQKSEIAQPQVLPASPDVTQQPEVAELPPAAAIETAELAQDAAPAQRESLPASEMPLPVLEEPPLPPLKLVESEFDILRGAEGTKIGQTSVRYALAADDSYVLESVSEAKGLASIFIPGKLVQRSEGRLTEDGLKPSSFIYQYGRSSRAQQASFVWEKRKLTLTTSKGVQTTVLPADAQDLMSFMYQFMFVPPLQEMLLNITNGKRIKAYAYSFAGEEELSTKIGNLRVMHLENTNDDGDEKNELWLAVDYRYLPVKIRKTEKDGSVIEQIITSIKTDNMQ
jgi:hypothetical protein